MKVAKITEAQQVNIEDWNNLTFDPRDSLDVAVREAVGHGKRYAGGVVTKVNNTTIKVSSPTYLFKSGQVFSYEDVNGLEIDLLSILPVSGYKRIVAVVINGVERDEETETRDYETDGTVFPPLTEARPTATRIWRKCEISTITGEAAPDPVRPTIAAELTVIAYVTLDSVEVLQIEQVEETRIVPLEKTNQNVQSLDAWRQRAEPALGGLLSDVASLANNQTNGASRNLISHILQELARVKEKAGLDSGAVLSQSDFFLDTSGTELTHLEHLAKVEEGVRFDHANEDEMSLSLRNPIDSRFVVHNDGLLLPKYINIPLISNWGKDDEVALSNSGAQTVDYRKRTVSRSRLRWGNAFQVCTNSQWWATGRYDSAQGVFTKNGESWRVEFSEQHPSGNPLHSIKRLRKIWIDNYDEIYWDAFIVDASFTGNVGGNTFLAPRSGWMTSINLGFSRVDAGGGDVKLLLCQTTASGSPDPNNVIAETTILADDLKTFPEKTVANFDPVFLEGSKRYAWLAVTAGNHWIAMSQANKYAQGSWFVTTDNAWFQGDIEKDACFEVNIAEFEAPRLQIELDNWNLDGGLTDIDLLLEQIAVDSTSITFEIRVNGVWVALDEVAAGNHPLYGQPASVDVRMVLLGTTDLMPGIYLTNSFVTLSRPRNQFVAITNEVTTPVDITEVEQVLVLEHYDETDHDCDCKLLVGAGFDTEVVASTTTDRITPDGSVERTFVFSGLSPTSSFKRKYIGDTVSPLTVFHIAEATTVALP